MSVFPQEFVGTALHYSVKGEQSLSLGNHRPKPYTSGMQLPDFFGKSREV